MFNVIYEESEFGRTFFEILNEANEASSELFSPFLMPRLFCLSLDPSMLTRRPVVRFYSMSSLSGPFQPVSSPKRRSLPAVVGVGGLGWVHRGPSWRCGGRYGGWGQRMHGAPYPPVLADSQRRCAALPFPRLSDR